MTLKKMENHYVKFNIESVLFNQIFFFTKNNIIRKEINWFT